MRRVFASRGTTAAAVGILVALIAGGGYAFASGGGSKKITACVHHNDGELYQAKKCAKNDKRLTWNKTGPRGRRGIRGPRGPQGVQGPKGNTGNTGPQGPGATYISYDANGSASPTPTTIGAVGPWTVTGSCQQSAGTTTIDIALTGPGGRQDGLGNNGAISETFGPLTNSPFDEFSSSSTMSDASSGQFLLIPTSGSAVEFSPTASVTGGATNTCHFTGVVTPVSAATATAAAHSSTTAKVQTAKGASSRVNGVTIH